MSVGAAKTGTTWLYSMIRDHEDIYFSPEKEINYFAHANNRDWNLSYQTRSRLFLNKAKYLKQLPLNEFEKELDWYTRFLSEPINDEWYKDLFTGQQSEKYIADFSNSTCLLNKRGMRHVAKSFNDLKLIYILRDPVERLWSHVKFHLVWTGQQDLINSWSDNEFINFAKKKHIERQCNYIKNISNMAKSFDENQYKIIFFEYITDRPVYILNQIETFLGIEKRSYENKRVRVAVNKGQDNPISDNVKHAYREMLDKQYVGIKELGLNPPDTWNYDL